MPTSKGTISNLPRYTRPHEESPPPPAADVIPFAEAEAAIRDNLRTALDAGRSEVTASAIRHSIAGSTMRAEASERSRKSGTRSPAVTA